MRSRTSWEAGLLPIGPLALEINFQYRRNPALCQRTTVSGLTKMSDCFQPDHTRRATIQKVGRSSRGLDAECAPSALLTAEKTQCQILKEETLSRAKRRTSVAMPSFTCRNMGGQL